MFQQTNNGIIHTFAASVILVCVYGEGMRYGHIHIAKTGGTTLNTVLAHRHQRVCGHKGYSETIDAILKNMEQYQGMSELDQVKAVQSDMRGRVSFKRMVRHGFETCDWVSLEEHYNAWKEVAKAGPLELHLPCRSPLEHYISRCNHLMKAIDGSLPQCVLFPMRFSVHLLNMPNTTLRCYDFNDQYTKYVNFMKEKLELRNSTVPLYHRPTNTHLNKRKHLTFLSESALMNAEHGQYYQFCRFCLQSELNLF